MLAARPRPIPPDEPVSAELVADALPATANGRGLPTPAAGSAAVDPQQPRVYRMGVSIHRVAGCGDASGPPEYYAVVDREDGEAWARVDATVAEAQRAARVTDVWRAWSVLTDLARREHLSRIEPLAEAEQQQLGQLREKRRSDRSSAEREKLRELAQREALSPAEAHRLERLRPLRPRWRSQLQQVRMQEGESYNRGHLRSFLLVYPYDTLRISVREWDTFRDDRCLDTTAVLAPAALERGSLQIRHGNQVALTLLFSP